MLTTARLNAPEPTFRELFTPKLVTVLREGYDLSKFRADALAGLTVAIVALPLSMAIAIASGATPDRGLTTAIVAGFLVSALGGSRYQIAGPAGAFIVLVAAVVDRHGLDGLALATMMAGLMMMAIGFLRIGAYIRYIPHPVIIGFTAGLGVIILASQLRELLGLTLPGREPGALIPKLAAIGGAIGTVNPAAVGIAAVTIGLILGLRRYRPTWPGFLIAVATAGVLTALLGLPVETIGSRFGDMPRSLPAPHLPTMSWAKVQAVLPDAVAIAILSGIESLLSAVVADAMSGRRHRSNCELVAQGIANIVTPLFGGICATGTIARTATNVRSGAVGPVSGILHAAFLLLFILVAAPLAAYVPLAALAGLLAIVAWNMAEHHEFIAILTRSRGEAAVLLATFLLTVFRDLTEGIAVGVVLGSLVFMHRMAGLAAVEVGAPLDEGDAPEGERSAEAGASRDVMVYRIAGPLFFGASSTIARALERIGRFPKAIILDLSTVPLADLSAAASLKTFVERAERHGARVYAAGVVPAVRHVLVREGLKPPLVRYAPNVEEARLAARQAGADA